ncbi:MAG: lysophospholipid acyltransferase family protein [Phycisphaerales bacterium JB040]
MIVYYATVQTLAALALMVLFRARWRGTGRVPRHGAFLVVANHQSFLDPPLVSVMCGRRHIDFIARGGLFGNAAFGRLISSLGSIPIREDGRGDLPAMKEALARLGRGQAVLVFPEGSRSFDGSMSEFKRGVAVLVKRANCPVVPVGLDGLYDAWPRTRRWPRAFGGRIAGVIGEPIDHGELMSGGVEAGMRRLEREVDALRLEARGMLRRATRGRYPAAGAGDEAFVGETEKN